MLLSTLVVPVGWPFGLLDRDIALERRLIVLLLDRLQALLPLLLARLQLILGHLGNDRDGHDFGSDLRLDNSVLPHFFRLRQVLIDCGAAGLGSVLGATGLRRVHQGLHHGHVRDER